MGKKGVSPAIATVLLISMVIVLGLIIFLWMRGLTKEAVTKFDGENIELACGKVAFEASFIADELSILNNGNVPLYDFKLKIFKEGGHTTESLKNDASINWPSYGLNPGESFSEDISIGNYDEIVLIPVLLGQGETGQKIFTCNERDGVSL